MSAPKKRVMGDPHQYLCCFVDVSPTDIQKTQKAAISSAHDKSLCCGMSRRGGRGMEEKTYMNCNRNAQPSNCTATSWRGGGAVCTARC